MYQSIKSYLILGDAQTLQVYEIWEQVKYLSEMMKGNSGESGNGMSAMFPLMMMGGNMGSIFDGMFDFDSDENEEENEESEE